MKRSKSIRAENESVPFFSFDFLYDDTQGFRRVITAWMTLRRSPKISSATCTGLTRPCRHRYTGTDNLEK